MFLSFRNMFPDIIAEVPVKCKTETHSFLKNFVEKREVQSTPLLLDYTERMESMGFFLAALFTGKNVARTAVNAAIPKSIAKDGIPNTSKDAPMFSARDTFKYPQIK